MNDAKEIPMAEKDDKKSFEFTKDIDGVRKTVRGRQVENGWIISINKSWTEELTGEYKYVDQEYITKSNPLEKLQDEKAETKDTEDSEMINLVQSISGSTGMLMVD